jgi:hypothetical protein
LLRLGEFAEARAHHNQALAIYDPAEHRPLATRFGQDIKVSILSLRSLDLWSLGYPEAALADADQALKDAREIGQATSLMFALGFPLGMLIHCGNYATATKHCDELIALADEKGAIWKALGMIGKGCVFALTGKASLAVQMITFGIAAWRSTGATAWIPDRAIALKPDYVEAHSNRGNALLDLKRPEEALASYDRAIALKPDDADAFWNQSLCLLQMGHYERGWRQYEWRKKRTEPVGDRIFHQPVWLGEEDVAGKTLFIHWEQGLGDTIQFCRYVKLVEARGAKIIMSVQEPLRGLLRQISPGIQIIHQNEVPTDFDFHCPLLSLPLALGTTLETIPSERQYLKADHEFREVWSARLSAPTKPRIGLVWSGGAAHKNDYSRSIALEQLVSLLRLDAHWISLQKEVRDKDAAVLLENDSIAHFGDDLSDFRDTAALLDLIDLIITVDTSVAHLAGAMGKPVWILLPYNSDWRWLLHRTDTPWYPSVRLFRQQQIGDWAAVIDQVKHELSFFLRLEHPVPQ